MAYLDLSGLEYPPSLWPAAGVEVYVKARWGDEWTWLPFLTCDEVVEAVSPAMSRATLRIDYGRIWRAEVGEWDVYEPVFINGAYVLIMVYDWWGYAPLWMGVADLERIRMDGASVYAQGEQEFQCYGMEHMLDRLAIHGAYIAGGDFIDRPVTFNQRQRDGINLLGNKADGEYAFGTDDIVWSHADILGYLWQNWMNSGAIYFDFFGEGMDALAQITEEVNLDGLTIKQALDTLIDRRRGLGWRIVWGINEDGTLADDTFWIYVFSTLPDPLAAGELLMPAAAFQDLVTFTGSRIDFPTVSFNSLARYDVVVARGGPLYSCFSLSYADQTLEEGWSAEQEAAYAAGSSAEDAGADEHDAERGTEKYLPVYQEHRVPVDWDGMVRDGEGGDLVNARPTMLADATLDTDTVSPLYVRGLRFERWLPLEIDSTGEEPRMQSPLVVVLAQNEEESVVWAKIDKLDALGKSPSRVSMNERGLGVVLQGKINHVFAGQTRWGALDPAPADTNTEPELDYEDMIATVNLATDQMLRAIVFVPSQPIPWDEIDRTLSPALQRRLLPEILAQYFQVAGLARVKFIDDDTAQMWYVAPGTVIDVTDGALVRHEGGVVRDDGERLRARALLAAAFYTTPRATLNWRTAIIDLAWPCGYMVRGLIGPEGYTEINTTVTERVWRFSGAEQSTTVSTGHEEIDFGRAVK